MHKPLTGSNATERCSRVGAWQLLILRSGEWPYGQPRRASRVPKFLPFRLFPHSKYSVWVDGKLKLLASPMSLIERFLIGPGASLALPRNKVSSLSPHVWQACKVPLFFCARIRSS